MRTAFLAALLALLAGCAQQPASSPPVAAPAQPVLERSCAILISSSPPFSDPKIDEFWNTVTRRVAERVQARLFEKYRAERLAIEPKDRGRGNEQVGIAMARYKCNRILQVSIDVNTDGQGPYFSYDISMLGVTPTRKTEGGTIVTTHGIYAKRYRYPRSKEVMDTFSMSEFGDRVFTDLVASGALEGIRRP